MLRISVIAIHFGRRILACLFIILFYFYYAFAWYNYAMHL